MRGQWQLELEHVSGRTKNFTDLEIDEKILLSLEGTGDTWGITVSCVTANVCQCCFIVWSFCTSYICTILVTHVLA